MDQISLSNIGIEKYIHNGESLAVAHKLGGDNMTLLEANRKVIEVLGKQSVTQTFSVSAFRSSSKDFNTTNKLIQAGESQDKSIMLEILSEISDFHHTLLEEILESSSPLLRQYLLQYTKTLFKKYKVQAQASLSFEKCVSTFDYQVGVGDQVFSLLSIGEVIAAKVLVEFLKWYNISAVYVDIPNLKGISPQNLARDTKIYLHNEFKNIFKQHPYAIPIVPGYIGGIQGGILAKLGRGYTDYTGERSTIALDHSQKYNQVLLYIQKLYGFKSTDPRALPEPGDAKSVNHLSYNLVERAISHKGAGAGLINEFALSEDIRRKGINILVGNPTDMSDIAVIDRTGDTKSTGVNLVLGRDYEANYDNKRYGIRCCKNKSQNHIIYLMGENLGSLENIFQQASHILRESGVESIAGELSTINKPEISLVFGDKCTAIKAQGILHRYFIES